MKRFLHKQKLIVLFFIAFLGGILVTNANVIPRFTNVNTETNQVTITNFGNQAVDLNNYWLCLGPGTYKKIGDLTPISGLINLPATQSIVLPYVMPVEGSGLSLYNSPSFTTASAVVDFVQWKVGGNIRESLAITQGLWEKGDFIMGEGPYMYISDGSENGVDQWQVSVDGGTITGGPFEFIVDGEADNIGADDIVLEGAVGSEMVWVITDEDLNILGTPPSFTIPDFDAAGVGVCLVWHLSHDGSLTGAEVGKNAADLGGNYDLSNSIKVTRSASVDGGTITGGPFEFIVDGEADNIGADDIVLEGAVGTEMVWVITDEDLNILGTPPSFTIPDFDAAGVGVCLVWHLSHDGTLTGAEVGKNAADLGGNYDLSNSIKVTRSASVDGGTITGGPFEFIVDGEADNIGADDIVLEGAVGSEMVWVITDEDLNILGTPPSFTIPDFDAAGVGVCLVWHLSHDGTLTGAEVGKNAADLGGNYDLSNSIKVTRSASVDGGTITGGPFTFCVDGEADNIGADDIVLEGAVGSEMVWVITDEDLNILGTPPSFTIPDFDAAGVGVCLVWHLSHDGSLTGAEVGKNAADLGGNYNLSNSIKVTRVAQEDCDALSLNDFDKELSVAIFPIPADDILNITTKDTSGNLEIKIFNLLGEEVTEDIKVIENDQIRINVQNLPPSIYIINIEDTGEGKQTYEQIVIE
ncbi:T9SS type A sorting domain-containing protein [Aquimarina agarilytica]|uniref:T9SS type A sorting domain-containing protein n=1 Tax=Aquimarina agarilytica TaxID=1087449 RepID=UPI000287F305|nr:T9SS type A sorting domain-containing protein [Aquimarina agarilytica]